MLDLIGRALVEHARIYDESMRAYDSTAHRVLALIELVVLAWLLWSAWRHPASPSDPDSSV